MRINQIIITENSLNEFSEQLDESLNELAPPSGNNGDDEMSILKYYAGLWWNGNDATRRYVEKTLAKMGWDIGEDEGNGGVFVVQPGDEHGKSYESWSAEDLTEGYDKQEPGWRDTPDEWADRQEHEQGVTEGENWSKYNNKRAGGMSKKSVSSYRRSHPGSKIQTAVTTKPSKLKKGSKSAKRRASFCARMRGMKKHRTGAKTARDPNSNINKSLRRWHCESVEQLQELVMLAEQKLATLKEAGSPAKRAAIAINMKKDHKKPKHVNESDNIEQSKYLQGAKDIIKGADPHHIARVRNLDPETLQRYVKLVWAKLDSKEYNYRKPDLAEVKDDDDDGLIGGRYTPEQWAKMIANLKRKAQEQDAKKKQQEQSKDLSESSIELNNILTLSGNNK